MSQHCPKTILGNINDIKEILSYINLTFGFNFSINSFYSWRVSAYKKTPLLFKRGVFPDQQIFLKHISSAKTHSGLVDKSRFKIQTPFIIYLIIRAKKNTEVIISFVFTPISVVIILFFS